MPRTFFWAWVRDRAMLAGDKRYQVSLGLAERMVYTELRGLSSDDIRLPFPTISIEISSTLVLGPLSSHEYPKTLFIQEETPGGATREAGVSRVWNMVLLPAKWARLPYGEHGALELYLLARLCFTKGEKWEAVVSLGKTGSYELSPLISDHAGAAMFSDFGPETITIYESLFRLAANLVLYATNNETRASATNKEYNDLTARIQKTPGGPKKERLKERRRSLDPEYKIVLGANVRPIPDAMREGNKIGVRTLVSGFWRNQAHGPKFSLRKQKWIEPFWRGVELGEEAPATNPIRVLQVKP